MDKLKIPPPLPNSNLWPPLSPGPLLRNLPFFNHGTCLQLWYSWIVTRYSWNSRKASRYTSNFYFLPTTWEDSKSLFYVLFEAFLVEVTSITQITTKSVRGKNCTQISEQRDATRKGIKKWRRLVWIHSDSFKQHQQRTGGKRSSELEKCLCTVDSGWSAWENQRRLGLFKPSPKAEHNRGRTRESGKLADDYQGVETTGFKSSG